MILEPFSVGEPRGPGARHRRAAALLWFAVGIMKLATKIIGENIKGCIIRQREHN